MVFLLHVFEKQEPEKGVERENGKPFICCPLLCLQHLGLGQAEGRNWKSNLVLPHSWEGTTFRAINRCLLKCTCAGRWLESGTEPGPALGTLPWDVSTPNSILTAVPNSAPFYFRMDATNLLSTVVPSICTSPKRRKGLTNICSKWILWKNAWILKFFLPKETYL